MDWESIGYAIGALFLGCALRTLLPYVTTGLKLVGESGQWSDWPRFEPSYLTSFVLAAIAYGIVFLTVPGSWEAALDTPFIFLVSIAYAGQDIAREAVRTGQAIGSRMRA